MKRFFLFFFFAFAVLLQAGAQGGPFFSEDKCTATRQSRQGAACYDGVLFQFHNANGVVEVFDLSRGVKLDEIVRPEVARQHCNTVAFGRKRWAKGDRFPLIYVSTERDDRILVCRITENSGRFSIETVQNILLPKSEEMGLYFPNSIIDGRGRHLWLSGYARNSWQKASDGNHLRYIRFALPDPHAGDVTIDFAKKQREFTLPFTYATQGVVFHKGRICQAYGVPKETIMFRVINPRNGKIVSEKRSAELGVADEPEGTFVYRNRLAVVTILGDCYYVEK